MRKFREFSSSSQLGFLLLVRFLFRFVRPFSFFLPSVRLSLRHSTCLNVWFVTFESDERAAEERCTFIKSAFNCSFFLLSSFFFFFFPFDVHPSWYSTTSNPAFLPSVASRHILFSPVLGSQLKQPSPGLVQPLETKA